MSDENQIDRTEDEQDAFENEHRLRAQDQAQFAQQDQVAADLANDQAIAQDDAQQQIADHEALVHADAHEPGVNPQDYAGNPPIPNPIRDAYPIVSEAKQREFDRQRSVETHIERAARETPVSGDVLEDRVPAYEASRTLAKGTILHINGLPFQLGADTVVYGEEPNFAIALNERP
jgi:hypothetical protein